MWCVADAALPIRHGVQDLSFFLLPKDSNLVPIVAKWRKLHLQLFERAFIGVFRYPSGYGVVDSTGLGPDFLRLAFQPSSSGTLLIATLSQVSAHLPIIQVGNDAMAHQPSHFLSEVDVLASVCCALAKELVGDDRLFAWREREERDDVVDAGFERCLPLSVSSPIHYCTSMTYPPFVLEHIPELNHKSSNIG